MSKKILSLILSLIMLFSCTGLTIEASAASDDIVRIGVFSDTHKTQSGIDNAFANINTLAGGIGNVDGVVLNGDITYMPNGTTPAASHYAGIIGNTSYQTLKTANKLVYAMGNHEFPNSSASDAALTEASKAMFTAQTGFALQCDTVLGGYHFINGAPENYDGKMQVNEAYFKEKINAALAESADKPVFLVTHHPVNASVIGSPAATDDRYDDRYSADFQAYLKSNPRIIVLSGHTHHPASDARSIRQYVGGCTYVATAHVSGGNAVTNHTKKVSQAMMIEINPTTNVVTLKPFYVGTTAEYLDQPVWTLDIPAMVAAAASADTSDDLAAFKYTFDDRTANSVAPAFAAGSTVTSGSTTSSSATITFPAADMGAKGNSADNVAKSYKIYATNLDNYTSLGTKRTVSSDHFLRPSERNSSYTTTVEGLEAGTSYRLDVVAVNTWGKESQPISCTVTTKDAAAFEEVTLDSDNTIDITAYYINNDKNSPYKRNPDDASKCYIQVPNTASTHTFTATFNITKAGIYRFFGKVGAVGAPSTAVINKVDEEGNVIRHMVTGEGYIATGNVSVYSYLPYADVKCTPGTYTMTWSRGASGDTATLMAVRAGWFAPLPVEDMEQGGYTIAKTAGEAAEAADTTATELTLTNGGTATWEVTPEYPGTYELTYGLTGGSATTTVTAKGFAQSGGDLTALPTNATVTAGTPIEVQLFPNMTYTFTLNATADSTTVTGMNLVWQENLGDLTDGYTVAYNLSNGTNNYTDLAYGNIDYANVTAEQNHFKTTITVPYDANYTVSLNVGTASNITARVFIERVSGGDVSISSTGALATVAKKTLFENVPLKAGEEYTVTIFCGTSGKTIRLQDLIFTTTGAYEADIDKITVLARDYSSKGSTHAETRHAIRCIANNNLSYKLNTGAGTYKVYVYTKVYSGRDATITLAKDGTKVNAITSTTSGTVTKQELGTICVTDEEFTLKLTVTKGNLSSTGTFIYRLELVAIDEPEVTMYTGNAVDSTKVATALTEGSMTARAYFPKELEGNSVTMLMAIYEDGVLYKVNTYSINAAKKNSFAVVTVDDIDFAEGKTYTSKIFFWNDLKTLKPLYDLPAAGQLQGSLTATAEN